MPPCTLPDGTLVLVKILFKMAAATHWTACAWRLVVLREVHVADSWLGKFGFCVEAEPAMLESFLNTCDNPCPAEFSEFIQEMMSPEDNRGAVRTRGDRSPFLGAHA